MPQITGIRPQKKKTRFNIYLDGKFAFGLPAEALVKAGLKIGQLLSDKEIEKLIKENEYDKYYNGVLKFISLRPRSEKEISDWFKKREVGQQTKNLVWQKLQDLGYVNDEEFAKWWVEQRQSFRPTGFRGLALELRQKGISQETIVKLLNGSIVSLSEREMAKKAAEKKMKLWQKLPPLELKKKMTSFLGRRGFSWEIIEEVIDEIIKKE